MLTCQHWLRERDMGRGNRGSDRRWQKMNRSQWQKDSTETGEAQDGEEYWRTAAEVKWGVGVMVGGEMALSDAGWGASYDLYVTQLKAHFLSVSVCLPFAIVSLRSLSHLQWEGTCLMVSKLKRLSMGAFSVPSLNLSGGDECTPTPSVVTTQLRTVDAIKILI